MLCGINMMNFSLTHDSGRVDSDLDVEHLRREVVAAVNGGRHEAQADAARRLGRDLPGDGLQPLCHRDGIANRNGLGKMIEAGPNRRFLFRVESVTSFEERGASRLGLLRQGLELRGLGAQPLHPDGRGSHEIGVAASPFHLSSTF